MTREVMTSHGIKTGSLFNEEVYTGTHFPVSRRRTVLTRAHCIRIV